MKGAEECEERRRMTEKKQLPYAGETLRASWVKSDCAPVKGPLEDQG